MLLAMTVTHLTKKLPAFNSIRNTIYGNRDETGSQQIQLLQSVYSIKDAL